MMKKKKLLMKNNVNQKRKWKKSYCQESSSESDYDTSQPPKDDEISIFLEKPIKSQRNRKSVITVHEPPINKTIKENRVYK